MFHAINDWLEPYIGWLAHALLAQHAWMPLLLLTVEEAGIPLFIPGSALVAFTGYRMSLTDNTPLWLAFCIAQTAVLIGASVLFFASRRWGHIIVDKIGRFIFLRQHDIQRAEQLFQKYGVWTIIVGRNIPGMRMPLTIFAGTSGMRYRTFLIGTIASTALWIWLALVLGKHVGASLEHMLRHNVVTGLSLIGFALIVIVSLHIAGRFERVQQFKQRANSRQNDRHLRE